MAPYTAVCHSLESEVFRIMGVELLKKLHNMPEAIEVITKITKMKEDTIAKQQLDGLINI